MEYPMDMGERNVNPRNTIEIGIMSCVGCGYARSICIGNLPLSTEEDATPLEVTCKGCGKLHVVYKNGYKAAV